MKCGSYQPDKFMVYQRITNCYEYSYNAELSMLAEKEIY